MRVRLQLFVVVLAGWSACGTQAAEPLKGIRSARSGAWSQAETWEGGKLPGQGDRVLVREGHTVTYDVKSDKAIRVLHVAGTVKFATDRDTQLNVGLLRIQPDENLSEEGFECDAHVPQVDAGKPKPALIVGTPEQPVEARCQALIRLVYFEGMNKESCPAIVCCGGQLDLHGAPMNRTWVKLGKTTYEDDEELTLAEPVEGWRAGQTVLVVSTARLFLFGYENGKRTFLHTVRTKTESEERVIKAVSGTKIEFEKGLDHVHKGDGDYRGEVANLSRNVIVESADPAGVRGHTMYHRGSAGSISYAELRHLGKKDVLGRYSLHYHLCRDSMRGSSVIGASIHDSDNRWITIHGTDYLLVRDCVGYNSIGHGFFLEDGTEVFNVLDRNLAVQARHGKPLPKQVLPFDDNSGAGFWWSNSLNSFTRNVAAECDQYGYRFEAAKEGDFSPVLRVPQPDGALKEVDVRTLPFVRFQDNEAHTHRRFAFNLGGIRHVSDENDFRQVRNSEGGQRKDGDLTHIQGGHVDGVGPDYLHPFIIRNFKVWNSHWVFHGGSPCVHIDGIDADSCTYGIFKTRMDMHEYKNLKMKKIDTAEIFEPWGNSNVKENYFRYIDVKHDDLPPTTVITHVGQPRDGKIVVRGITADNGAVRMVTVNDKEVKPLRDNFSEWEVVLDKPSGKLVLSARAVDAKGNVEPRPHKIEIPELTTAASGRRE